MRRKSFPPQTVRDCGRGRVEQKLNNFSYLIRFNVFWGENMLLIEQEQLGNRHAIITYFDFCGFIRP